MRSFRNVLGATTLVLAVGWGRAGSCQAASQVPHATATALGRDEAIQKTSDVQITDLWLRLPPSGMGMSALYFTVANTSDAPVILRAVQVERAKASELHETTAAPGGVVTMQKISHVTIPAKGVERFQPGGRHVMVMGLPAGLREGQTIEVGFVLDQAHRVTLKAVVKP